MQIKMKK